MQCLHLHAEVLACIFPESATILVFRLGAKTSYIAEQYDDR